MKKGYLILFGIIFFSACEKQQQVQPVSDEDFRKLYIDAALIYAQTDSVHRREKIDSLLKERQISMDDLQKMVTHYNKDTEAWVDFFNAVTQELRTASNKEANNDKKISEKNDDE
ncbi:MAG: hypothetical protein DWQ05_13835 [Calditrichaeota bacterium]|nr:MAG: hypothetical protein DWQ05_13835 [Calditrichota bacterium]